MFIASKRNISIPSDDGTMSHFIPRDYVGPVPDWVAKTAYFAELVADGKISVSKSTQDKDVQDAVATPPKRRTKKEV